MHRTIRTQRSVPHSRFCVASFPNSHPTYHQWAYACSCRLPSRRNYGKDSRCVQRSACTSVGRYMCRLQPQPICRCFVSVLWFLSPSEAHPQRKPGVALVWLLPTIMKPPSPLSAVQLISRPPIRSKAIFGEHVMGSCWWLDKCGYHSKKVRVVMYNT